MVVNKSERLSVGEKKSESDVLLLREEVKRVLGKKTSRQSIEGYEEF